MYIPNTDSHQSEPFVLLFYVSSESIIFGSAAAFGRHPVDVLRRVLDIARFAVDAVLCVNLQPDFRRVALTRHKLVHT